MKRDLYRNQIFSALRETEQVSIHSLWGRRADGSAILPFLRPSWAALKIGWAKPADLPAHFTAIFCRLRWNWSR